MLECVYVFIILSISSGVGEFIVYELSKHRNSLPYDLVIPLTAVFFGAIVSAFINAHIQYNEFKRAMITDYFTSRNIVGVATIFVSLSVCALIYLNFYYGYIDAQNRAVYHNSNTESVPVATPTPTANDTPPSNVRVRVVP